MQVASTNDVKIYNLSAGRSLPEWLTDRKKRMLAKKHSEIRHRIELIQDFEMPIVSTGVKMSRDGQYLLATGIYKPRVRCFEVAQLSMKFERCFDSEVVAFEILSDNFAKMVFLQCDRYVEFHAAYGRYHSVRIPRFGRDLAYLPAACDLYFACDGPSVYRLNLDQGRFLNPIATEATAVNVCRVNTYHNLICLGTEQGKVEAYDPRSRSRVGVLECALNSVTAETELRGMPSVTALTFRDALTLGVGTATGQVLLFDLRSDRPLLVKDHMYGLPVKRVAFHGGDTDVVVSMDAKVIKFWERISGKAFTSVTPAADLNDLCLVGDSGLFFAANEDKKILAYYIPSLGPAPRWCSFLDNLTEELEETQQEAVYDDYKFVTKRELDDLGLGHLMGTNLLRAYMHGYFLDIRLYHKARSMAQPFAYDEYKKKKIKETIDATRKNRVGSTVRLPTVNRELARKLHEAAAEEEEDSAKPRPKSKSKPAAGMGLLEDSRFKAIFENTDFEVDPTSDEYRLLQPIVTRLEKHGKKQQQKRKEGGVDLDLFEPVNETGAGEGSSEEESSDDDQGWMKEVKRRHKEIRQEAKLAQPKLYELKSGVELNGASEPTKKKTAQKLTLERRLEKEHRKGSSSTLSVGGNRSMTFETKRTTSERQRKEAENKKHMEERKKTRRSAKGLKMAATKPGLF